MSKRVIKDIQAIKEDQEWKFTVFTNDNDLSQLKAQFSGPTSSPYEGGTFTVEFKIPKEYPLKPPVVRFDTPVYHPNVSSQTGAICLDILKTAWTPVYSIKSILISLQQLLDSPNASDPQDAEVARVYMENRQEFNKVAKEWTRKYAEAISVGADPETVDAFVQMGFEESQVQAALSKLGITKVDSEEQHSKVLEELLG